MIALSNDIITEAIHKIEEAHHKKIYTYHIQHPQYLHALAVTEGENKIGLLNISKLAIYGLVHSAQGKKFIPDYSGSAEFKLGNKEIRPFRQRQYTRVISVIPLKIFIKAVGIYALIKPCLGIFIGTDYVIPPLVAKLMGDKELPVAAKG